MVTMDTQNTKSFTIQNRSGDVIHGDIHLPEKIENASVMIVCHGFKGFKDWGFFPYTAQRFAEEGWCCVRFNFSHNGIGEDFQNFTEADKFARNTISKELEDLDAIISAVHARTFLPDEIDINRLALLGHSRGGGNVIIKGATDSRVKSVVTWATVSNFDRWGEHTKKKWREDGFIEILNTRTKQYFRINKSLLDDLESNVDRLNILQSTEQLHKPLLIIHGEQDVSVPCKEAGEIYSHADHSITEMEIISNADHTFGIVHPFAGVTIEFGSVLQRTIFWLRINTRPSY